MADTVKLVEIDHFKEKLIELLYSMMVDDECLSNEEIAEILIANDVVPVVRCKGCKQWSRNSGVAESPNGHCFCHDIETNGHDFCSYGERKDNA